jgi:hypothetical protein
VTGNDRFSLMPYMFTHAIFMEKFCQRIEAWGYHGFLPKSRALSAQNQIQPQGNNLQKYHAQLLVVVLQTFKKCHWLLKECNSSHWANWSNDRGCQDMHSVYYSIHARSCLLFNICKKATVVWAFVTHTSKGQRQCRSCNVNYDDLDNLTDPCCYVYAGPMAQFALCRNNSTLRQQLSQHALDNTCNHVPLADPIHDTLVQCPWKP